ncbi:hypothetical protein D3C72_2028250 [compost metagenome]
MQCGMREGSHVQNLHRWFFVTQHGSQILCADQHQALEKRIRSRARHARWYFAIDQQPLPQICHACVPRHARPKLIIFRGLPGGIGGISTLRLDHRLAQHNRTVHERIVEQKFKAQCAMVRRMIVRAICRRVANPDLRCRT